VVVVDKVVRRFGPVMACAGVSFAAPEKSVTVLLGPNGAGKSTVLGVVSGRLMPHGGDALVEGASVSANPIGVRALTGSVAEDQAFSDCVTARGFLRFACALRLVPRRDRDAEVSRVAELCSVTDVLNRPARELSRGYRRRLALAGALVSDPPVLVLDEPTAGLDPAQLAGFRELVRSLAQTKTVILSTHILSEAEAVADRIVVIAEGLVRAEGSVDEIRGQDGLERAFLRLVEATPAAEAPR